MAAVCGRYGGEGRWVDETGETRPYKVDLRIQPIGGGRVRTWFKHDFVEEGMATEQSVILEPRAGGVLGVCMDGPPITGRGYFTGDSLHYELDVPNNRVEVSILFSQTGAARVIGSSEKNAQGRFIWWTEQLTFGGS
jgi:hypothetical protein